MTKKTGQTRKQFLKKLEAVSLAMTAAPALDCSDGYYRDSAIKWDPVNIKLP